MFNIINDTDDDDYRLFIDMDLTVHIARPRNFNGVSMVRVSGNGGGVVVSEFVNGRRAGRRYLESKAGHVNDQFLRNDRFEGETIRYAVVVFADSGNVHSI